MDKIDMIRATNYNKKHHMDAFFATKVMTDIQKSSYNDEFGTYEAYMSMRIEARKGLRIYIDMYESLSMCMVETHYERI